MRRASETRSMPRKRLAFSLALAPVAAVAGSLVGALAGLDALDRRGRRFYAAGRSVVDALDELGRAVLARDLDGVRGSYADDYRGWPLGLDALAGAAAAAEEK